MSPINELRAAATALRETAAKATPGPWVIREGNDVSSNVTAMDHHMVIDGGGWTDGVKAVVYGAALNADAEWIALANTALAEPLADLLDWMADSWPKHEPHTTTALAVRGRSYALAVARAINTNANRGAK